MKDKSVLFVYCVLLPLRHLICTSPFIALLNKYFSLYGILLCNFLFARNILLFCLPDLGTFGGAEAAKISSRTAVASLTRGSFFVAKGVLSATFLFPPR